MSDETIWLSPKEMDIGMGATVVIKVELWLLYIALYISGIESIVGLLFLIVWSDSRNLTTNILLSGSVRGQGQQGERAWCPTFQKRMPNHSLEDH